MLVVCSRCRRHAKPAAACFFCGAALVARRPSPSRRASRAGAFAAIAAAGMACAARTELGVVSGAADASIDAQTLDVQSNDVALDAPAVFYGGPFPNDAAAPQDAGADSDATGIALYGAPPPNEE